MKVINNIPPNYILQTGCKMTELAFSFISFHLHVFVLLIFISRHKKASNHHANLLLEMYSFTL